MAFKDRLKEARLNKGFTQEQVAEKIGVAKSTFTGYEKGNSEPNMFTISQIMNILKVDANFLWQDEMDALGGNPMQVKYNEMKLLEKYRSLDDFGRETVDLVLDREVKRKETFSYKDTIMQHINETSVSPAAKIRYIHYYQRLASAGTGQFVFNNLPVDMIAIPDIPKYRKVQYAIGVNGHSMEPDYKDGDIVLVAPDIEVVFDDIGIFIENTDAYIKKRGKDELISLNPEYENIPLTNQTRCLGLVVDKYTPILSSDDEDALEFSHDLLEAKNLLGKHIG